MLWLLDAVPVTMGVEALYSGTKHHEVPVTMTMGGEHEFDEHTG